MTLPDKKHLAAMEKSNKGIRQKRLSKRNLLSHDRNDIDENEEFTSNSDTFLFSKRNKPDLLEFTNSLLLVDEIKQESFISNADDDSQGRKVQTVFAIISLINN